MLLIANLHCALETKSSKHLIKYLFFLNFLTIQN